VIEVGFYKVFMLLDQYFAVYVYVFHGAIAVNFLVKWRVIVAVY